MSAGSLQCETPFAFFQRCAPSAHLLFAGLFGSSLPLVHCRVHSIFVLRLFNDGVAMWLLYAAVYLFLLNRCHILLTCAEPTAFVTLEYALSLFPAACTHCK